MIRLRYEMTTKLVLLRAGDLSTVQDSLQAAIKLEHAIIPPYLYALYSLGLEYNQNIAEIIKSVVAEEMLHLVLAANILNAIGGSPILNRSSFIPHYPGPLPGAVAKGLKVRLEPCSKSVIRRTFMKIEQPEPGPDAPGAESIKSRSLTVGQFYREIRAALIKLGDQAFHKRPHNQITPDLMARAIAVTDVATACHAIDIIIDQGEGTATTPLEIYGRDYAHYFRFKEIVKGCQLIPNPKAGPGAPKEEPYIYAGPPIKWNEKMVITKMIGGSTGSMPVPGSLANRALITFNYTYTSLLRRLHTALNGRQDDYQATIGLMMSLRQQAIDMMSGVTTGNIPVGPTFTWKPVNDG